MWRVICSIVVFCSLFGHSILSVVVLLFTISMVQIRIIFFATTNYTNVDYLLSHNLQKNLKFLFLNLRNILYLFIDFISITKLNLLILVLCLTYLKKSHLVVFEFDLFMSFLKQSNTCLYKYLLTFHNFCMLLQNYLTFFQYFFILSLESFFVHLQNILKLTRFHFNFLRLTLSLNQILISILNT